MKQLFPSNSILAFCNRMKPFRMPARRDRDSLPQPAEEKKDRCKGNVFLQTVSQIDTQQKLDPAKPIKSLQPRLLHSLSTGCVDFPPILAEMFCTQMEAEQRCSIEAAAEMLQVIVSVHLILPLDDCPCVC